eukprot:79858-Prorocentrum_minimum.AAC.3
MHGRISSLTRSLESGIFGCRNPAALAGGGAAAPAPSPETDRCALPPPARPPLRPSSSAPSISGSTPSISGPRRCAGPDRTTAPAGFGHLGGPSGRPGPPDRPACRKVGQSGAPPAPAGAAALPAQRPRLLATSAPQANGPLRWEAPAQRQGSLARHALSARRLRGPPTGAPTEALVAAGATPGAPSG